MMSKKKNSSSQGPGAQDQVDLLSAFVNATPEAKQQLLLLSSSMGKSEKPTPKGYYHNPDDGKTYRIRQAKSKSNLRKEAEALCKAARNSCSSFLEKEGLQLVEKRLVTSEGKTPSKELQARNAQLVKALENAKLQLKLVKESEKTPSTSSKTAGRVKLDPLQLPKLQKDEAGKLSWADLMDNDDNKL